MCPACHSCQQLCWAVALSLGSASPGCTLLVPMPSSPVSPEVPDRMCDGDIPPTAARRSLHSPYMPEPFLAVPCVTSLSPLPGQRQRGDPGHSGLPRNGGMATQSHAATASCSPVALVRAPLCLCDAAQFCLWCGTRGNKERCLDVPFFPSLSSRLDGSFPSSNVPSTSLSPMEPSRAHGRAGASPWLQCHPDWQQGAVPGACFPGTADGVGEAAGPARPRTSAPTLSMSDSQSCQGLTGLMIVGAAGQEPLGTRQVRTPASCTLAAPLPPWTEGSPGPAEPGRVPCCGTSRAFSSISL